MKVYKIINEHGGVPECYIAGTLLDALIEAKARCREYLMSGLQRMLVYLDDSLVSIVSLRGIVWINRRFFLGKRCLKSKGLSPSLKRNN